MSDKILILTGDGGECYETWYAVHRFQEAGFVPEIAAPAKRRLHLVMHDFEPGWDTYIERPGYEIDADLAIKDVKVDDYVAVLLIGGRAPEYLRNQKKVVEILKEFDRQRKWILSICHGIQMATTAGLVRGKKVSCYEHVKFEVESCGGKWSPDPMVRDGNLISSPTWREHPEFFREVMSCLQETPASKTVAIAANA